MQKKIESGIFLGVFQSLIIMECCACRRVIGYKDGFGVDGVSHGYCPDCESQLKQSILTKLKGLKNDSSGIDVIKKTALD